MTKRGKRQLLIAIVSVVVLAMMIGLVYLITEKDQANKDGEKYMYHSESSNTEESSSENINDDTQQDIDSDEETPDSDEEPDSDEDTDKDTNKDTNKDTDKDTDKDTNKDTDKDTDKDTNKDTDKDTDKASDKASDKDKDESDTEEEPDTEQKPQVEKPESYAAYAALSADEQEKLKNDLGSKGFNNWLKEVGYDMETYNSMSEDEQQAFRDSFTTPGDYVKWYWTAHDALKAANG